MSNLLQKGCHHHESHPYQFQTPACGDRKTFAFSEIPLVFNLPICHPAIPLQRAAQGSIDLSQPNLDRLNEGVRLAGEKGLNDTLILIDQTAFLVNVPNNKVITAVNGGDLTGNVFTNIDGTVII